VSSAEFGGRFWAALHHTNDAGRAASAAVGASTRTQECWQAVCERRVHGLQAIPAQSTRAHGTDQTGRRVQQGRRQVVRGQTRRLHVQGAQADEDAGSEEDESCSRHLGQADTGAWQRWTGASQVPFQSAAGGDGQSHSCDALSIEYLIESVVDGERGVR